MIIKNIIQSHCVWKPRVIDFLLKFGCKYVIVINQGNKFICTFIFNIGVYDIPVNMPKIIYYHMAGFSCSMLSLMILLYLHEIYVSILMQTHK